MFPSLIPGGAARRLIVLSALLYVDSQSSIECRELHYCVDLRRRAKIKSICNARRSDVRPNPCK